MTKTKTKVAAKRAPSFQARLLALAISSCFSGALYAAGVNPVLVAGSAKFSPDNMTVTNSNGTIINWDALSVPQGEKLEFIQDPTSSVLNRVIGMEINGKRVIDPTIIAGTISSKGSVWIVNTSGIMVKQGAQIDVARFVASTIDISKANFQAGKLLFDGDSKGGSVSVEKDASIKTGTGGSVYLIGSNVTNEGIITTPEGETILAAGKSVSIVDTGTPGVKVEIRGSEGNVTNLGTVLATAGRIGMAGALVRNSGTLNASSVVKEGGRIFLKASRDAYVDGDGRIVTTGTKGGKVEVLGNRVAVMGNASIDASGTNGGGSVLVGGDYQGKNAAVQNSTITYFGKNASIKADALDKGNGGKVILWANDTTRAYGRISVRGGANGGKGGFVETSGRRYLDRAGIRVDARAPKGTKGSWLLDPTDITITHGGTTTGGFVNETSTLSIYDPGFEDSTTISDGDLSSYLSSASVHIETSQYGTGGNGDIILASGVSITGSNLLTLIAHRDIVMTDASIRDSGNGTLGVTMEAGRNIAMSGSTISTGGGNVSLTAVGNISLTGTTIASSGGAIDLTAGSGWTTGGNISMSGSSIQAGTGNVYLGAYSGSDANGDISVGTVSGHNVAIEAYGGIIDANGAGNVNVSGDSIRLDSFGVGNTASRDAIDLDVSVSNGGELTAIVDSGASYGGINLRNYGADPSAGLGLNLTDQASYSNNLTYYSATGIANLPTLSRDGNITIVSGGDLGLGGTLSGSSINLTAAGAVRTAIPAAIPVVNGEMPINVRPGPLSPYRTTAINATGNVSVSASSLNLTSSVLSQGSLTLTTRGDMQLSSVTVQGSKVDLTAGGAMQLSGTTVRAYSSDLTMKAASLLTMNNATLQAAGNINLAAQNILAVGSTIRSGYGWATAMSGGQFLAAGDVTMTANEDIVLNGTTVEAGNDVTFNLQGPTSTLYLNDQAGTYSPSKVVSDIYTQIPATIHINFLSNTSGGVVIDGVNTTTTTAGGSGFYVLNSSTPARPGYGLSVVYPTILSGTTEQVATETGASVERSTTNDNLTDKTSANSPMLTTSAPQGQPGTGDDDGATFDSKDKKDNGDSRDNKEQSNGKSTSKNQCS